MKRATHHNDPLDYLPRKPLKEYAKGECIYSEDNSALYLVAAGRVKVVSVAVDGGEALIRIVPTEGLFGESVFVGPSSQRAEALDRVQLMAWSRAEIEEQIEKQPRLALALMEELVAATLEMTDRIQAMACCKTPQRVMISLLQLARVLGETQSDGALRMASLTHNLISRHVGTSREIVSSEMNQLRRLGLVCYSRKHIDVYHDAMAEAIRRQAPLRQPTAASPSAVA